MKRTKDDGVRVIACPLYHVRDILTIRCIFLNYICFFDRH